MVINKIAEFEYAPTGKDDFLGADGLPPQVEGE